MPAQPRCSSREYSGRPSRVDPPQGLPLHQLAQQLHDRQHELGEAGLALTERLAADLDRYHYLHGTRAELLRRLDRTEEAHAASERALGVVHSDAKRRFLERRRAELAG